MPVKFDKLSLIIPVYNEARTIHQILDILYKLELVNNIQKEIILVDDCSKDNSITTIEQYIDEHPGGDMS